MFNVGGGEMFVILLLALIVLGPERLPKAMGQVGRFVGQIRKMSSGFQDEIQRAMDPGNAPFRPGEERLEGPRPAIEDEVKVVNPGGPGEVAAAAGIGPDGAPADEPGTVQDGDGGGETPPAETPPAEATEAPDGGEDDGGTTEGTVTPLRPRGDADGDGDARATG